MKKPDKEIKKNVCYKNGKIWFTKEAEKRFFFFMTIFMLLLGIISYTGLI